MARAFLSSGFWGLFLAVGATLHAADPATQAVPATAASELQVGEPVRHGNLTVFPITSRTLRDKDRFITLDEGLKAGTVEIVEAGALAGGGQAINNATSQVNAAPVAQQAAANPPGQSAAGRRPQGAARSKQGPGHGQQGSAAGQQGSATGQQGSATGQQGSAPARQAQRSANNARPGANRQTNAPQTPITAAPQQAPADVSSNQQAGHSQSLPIGGNDVNQLFVINRSEKPLYLMPGEIIIGGSQDRAIGREYVIEPSKRPQPISVYCVEHGRWGSRDQQELSALVATAGEAESRRGSVAIAGSDAQRLAQQANDGKFVGSVGKLSKGARIAVQEGQGQSAVWDEVGKENSKSSVKSKSGAFTGQYAEKEAVERLDPYLAAVQAPIAATDKVVGVIVAVNDRMDSAEILESTPLFKKVWPKLLKSYALDAANAKPDAANTQGNQRPKQACTRDDAIAFLTELQNAGGEAQAGEGGVSVLRHVGSRLSTSTALDPQAAAMSRGTGMGGGFGGGIHSSGISK